MQRVLLVDDSSTVRTVVARQLAELGLEIDHAEHGEEGLAKLAAGAYQLILLDVTMPVMDGPTMLQRLRSGQRSERRLGTRFRESEPDRQPRVLAASSRVRRRLAAFTHACLSPSALRQVPRPGGHVRRS